MEDCGTEYIELVTIIAISDTHGMHERLALPPGDVLVHAGDATMGGTMKEVVNFLNWMGRQPFAYKCFVPGNHDFYVQDDQRTVELMCVERGIKLLIDRSVEIMGIKFHGSPWVPNLQGWAFYGDSATLTNKFMKIPDDTRVLITHGPPAGILDDCGIHVGSTELWHRLQEVRPDVHIMGHIHEGYGHVVTVYDDSQTDHYNVAVCTREYRPTNPPTIIKIEV